MTQDKFIALARKGEGTQIEYKTCTEEISESLYESVCSFLNHTGGQILVGVQDENVTVDEKMSPSLDENVPKKEKMSQTNVPDKMKLSPSTGENVTEAVKMSQTGQEKVPELTDEELALPLEPFERLSVKEKKNKRRQAIVSLMAQNSHITSEEIAEKLDTHERTIKRDIKALRENGVIERIGGDFGGEWKVVKKK